MKSRKSRPKSRKDKRKKSLQPVIAVVMGSKTDDRWMKNARQLFEDFEVSFEQQIISAHRTPNRLYDFAESAVDKGLQVIIAGAGGAAHLPGMIASLTTVPVIGVPIPLEELQGLDSLLSIAQMPKGVPVATVAIGNATNAALLALQILAHGDPSQYKLRIKLQNYRNELQKKVEGQSLDKLDKRKRRP